MGRTTPSVGRAPAAVRKQQRAKRAKETASKIIPALLASHERARNGVAAAELIAGSALDEKEATQTGRAPGRSTKKSRGKGRRHDDKQLNEREAKDLEDQPDHKVSNELPKFKVSVTDTLTAAAAFVKANGTVTHSKRSTKAPNVAILNMASLLRPGGGFTSGATSQEEFLCMRTTLLPSLREDFYRLPEVGSIWTPDVLVFRDSTPEAKDLPTQDRFYVDVITAGMIRFPNVITRTTYKDQDGAVTDEIKADQVYASAADVGLVHRKMKAVLSTLQSKGCRKVVLGAWGCGAYGNPVSEIARAWKESLLETDNLGRVVHKHGLTDVVFAISQGKMATDFARAWGDIEVEDMARSGGSGYEGEDAEDGEDSHEGQAELDNLHAKIAQLQAQVDNARTPILRDGLEAVLRKLRHEVANRTGQGAQDPQWSDGD